MAGLLGGVLAVAGLPDRAGAQHLRPVLPPAAPAPGTPAGVPDGIVSNCWLTARVFRSLASGPVPFCRGHLRYHPGDFDCYQIADQACSVYLPTSQEWIETRRPFGPTVFPCPEGPEPPVCPRFTVQ